MATAMEGVVSSSFAAPPPEPTQAQDANSRLASSSLIPPLDNEAELLMMEALTAPVTPKVAPVTMRGQGTLTAKPAAAAPAPAHPKQIPLTAASGSTASAVVVKSEEADRKPLAPAAPAPTPTPPKQQQPATPPAPTPVAAASSQAPTAPQTPAAATASAPPSAAPATSEPVRSVPGFINAARPPAIPKATPSASTTSSSKPIDSHHVPTKSGTDTVTKERQPPQAPQMATPKMLAAAATSASDEVRRKAKDEERQNRKKEKKKRSKEHDADGKEKKHKKHRSKEPGDEAKSSSKKTGIRLKASDIFLDEAEEDNDSIDDHGDGEIVGDAIDLDRVGEERLPDSEEDVNQAYTEYVRRPPRPAEVPDTEEARAEARAAAEDAAFIADDDSELVEYEEGADEEEERLYREEIAPIEKKKSKHQKKSEARREWALAQEGGVAQGDGDEDEDAGGSSKRRKKRREGDEDGALSTEPIKIPLVPSGRDGKPLTREELTTQVELLLRSFCGYKLYQLTDKNCTEPTSEACVSAVEIYKLLRVVDSGMCLPLQVAQASTLRYLQGPDPNGESEKPENLSVAGLVVCILGELSKFGIISTELYLAAKANVHTLVVTYDVAVRAITAPETPLPVTISYGTASYTAPMDMEAMQMFEKISVLSDVLGEVHTLVVQYASAKCKSKVGPMGFLEPPIVKHVGEINRIIPNEFMRHAAAKLEQLTLKILAAHQDAVTILQDIRALGQEPAPEAPQQPGA